MEKTIVSNDTIQKAFDYAMENGVVLEVHELIEAFSNGLTHPADVLDFCLGMDADALKEERESFDQM